MSISLFVILVSVILLFIVFSLDSSVIDFKKNDRVVVIGGSYKHEHGKVVNGERGGFLVYTMFIKLDDSGSQHIILGHLEYEKLTPDEVTDAIKNVKNQVEKVASKLPLPSRVESLGKSIKSKDKSASNKELEYVKTELDKLSKNKSITPEWMGTIRIDLEKIDWVVKRLS